jgi:gas vesicle protein
MNDAMDSRGSPNMGSTVIAFALGAAVGAGLALLLAPDTGKKTRERLASTARRWTKEAGETIEHARDAMTDLGTDAKSALKAGQEAFVQDRVEREARSERWMAHAADGAPPTRNSQEEAVR